MGRYQRGFRRKQGRKGMVQDGLIFYLDGRDFSNNPATSLWYDRDKSKTIAYSNAITNGDFSNGATGWTLWSANLDSADGEAIFTGTNVGTYPNIYKTLTATVGRKYYFTAEVKAEDVTDIVKLAIRSESVETTAVKDAPSANTWYKLSCVKTCGNTSMTFAPSARYTSAAAATGKKVHVRKCMAIDLTALFGAGNEPVVGNSDTMFLFTAASSTTPMVAFPFGLAYTGTSGSDGVGGVVFDGVDDYIATPHLGITGSQPFTIMVKGKFITNESGDDVLFGYGSPGVGNKMLGFYARATLAKFKITVWNASDPATGFDKDFNEHVWALVYDGTGYTAYQDGVIDPTGRKTTLVPTFDTSSVLSLGRVGSSTQANGRIKKVAMYDKALVAQEILQNTQAMR